MERNWYFSNEIKFENDRVVLNDGTPDSNSFISLIRPLDRDDHISIDLTMSLGQLSEKKESQNLPDH